MHLFMCSEFIKIYDNKGTEMFSRRGCNSFAHGLSVEMPFADGNGITVAVLLKYRYSYARIQYTILDQALSKGKSAKHDHFILGRTRKLIPLRLYKGDQRVLF